MKKILVSLLIATTSTATLAANSTSAPAPTGSSIAALEAYIGEIYSKAMNYVVTQDSTPIPNAQTSQTINMAQAKLQGKPSQSPSQASVAMAAEKTSDNLSNTLTQFPYSMYEHDTTVAKEIKTAQKTPFSDYANQNSMLALTSNKNAAAKDTLYYIPSLSSFKESDNPLLKKPDNATDSFLNFSTIISPIAYQGTQAADAEKFLKYAAQSTVNFTSGLDLRALRGKPSALLSLKSGSSPGSEAYLRYQFSVRSLVAVRSMLINTINQLIAERTPMKGLGAAAGLSKESKASPLQVAAFQANRRAENLLTAAQKQLPASQQPNWYTSVENAPSATVQRETLIVLAEIEQQNFQAHIDRERILAAITALGLQSNTSATQNLRDLEAPKVKEAIQAAMSQTTNK